MYTYIYIYREREREIDIHTHRPPLLPTPARRTVLQRSECRWHYLMCHACIDSATYRYLYGCACVLVVICVIM